MNGGIVPQLNTYPASHGSMSGRHSMILFLFFKCCDRVVTSWHRPQHECTTPPPPPCRHGRHDTRQHSCWPCCPMGATARPHHGCHSTPPPWAPQHTPSEMAAWPWPATAPTCPLAQWLTVGRLLAPWAHWWGPHALGGCFAFFLHFAGCS